MFVRYFATIERPFEAVEPCLLSPPREWLPEVDPGSTERPESAVIRLSASLAGSVLTKKVRVALGPAVREEHKTSIPVHWSATGAKALFPKLWGTIEVARSGRYETLLALLVEYEPPLGKVGKVLDEALLHRLVWATLETFRDGLAAALVRLADDHQPVPANVTVLPSHKPAATRRAAKAKSA